MNKSAGALGEKSERLHQRLLDDALGIGGTARQPAREVVGLIKMGHHCSLHPRMTGKIVVQ